MTTTTLWTIFALAVIFAALIGFAIGRRQSPGGSAQLKELENRHEEELAQKQLELEAYQQKVHNHYNKTANLFKDMAGSYKELFDHLSVGYEQLGDHTDQRVLPERAGALLDEPDYRSEKNVDNSQHQGEEAPKSH
jgi:hypothetical protein